jgi:two-component sensor histidine kinase
VWVEDDGTGIPEGSPPSTGLGTSIVRTLVTNELLGSIEWSNRPEGGTSVQIVLDLHSATDY